MLYMQSQSKPGQWQTVKSKADDKKKREDKKKQEGLTRDRLGVTVDPTAAALAAFDRNHADREASAKQQQPKGYKGAFADLEDEAPPSALQDDGASSGGDEDAGPASSATANGTTSKQPKQPKQPKKPKLSVAQVAAGLDVAGLQGWMAEVQQRYSANETAQLEALSDKLLGGFKEASLDLAKVISTKGLGAASELPLVELPNPLLNALASFVAGLSEPALVRVLVPLVGAVVAEASGASGSQPPGKGKAGLLVMLSVTLRTRPQALVRAAAELRMAGRQLTGPGKLPLLLWVINQAALADPAVGVAVWVRLLLPQLLGVLELPSAAAAAPGGKGGKDGAAAGAGGAAAAGGGDHAQLLVPLDVPSQSAALEYLSGLLSQLGVGAGGAATSGGDITRGDGVVEPTVPGAAVETLSRLIAGKAWSSTGGGAAGGPAAAATAAAAAGAGAAAAAAAGGVAGESKRAVAARAAAASGLAPLLPGLTALAAVSSSGAQYSEWLVLALESAALSAAAPEAPDMLVLRSASNVVACLCGNEACYALWESKHKGSLRGSARVLAALLQQPRLLGPLLQQRSSKEAFRGLLAALPARHRAFLATGKGWQGACARVAEDACGRLPRKLGRGGWGGAGGAGGAGGGGGGVGLVMAALSLGSLVAGVGVVGGLYRREVAGIVAGYAGPEAAQQLDQGLLAHLEAGVQASLAAAGPYLDAARPHLEQLQAAAGPVAAQAWARVGPLVQQGQAEAVRLYHLLAQQLQDIAAKAKQA